MSRRLFLAACIPGTGRVFATQTCDERPTLVTVRIPRPFTSEEGHSIIKFVQRLCPRQRWYETTQGDVR